MSEKLTPREPTPEMISKARRVDGIDALVAATVWQAMHDAAPSAEPVADEPVAWFQIDVRTGWRRLVEEVPVSWDKNLWEFEPLYTRPAPAPADRAQRVPRKMPPPDLSLDPPFQF